MSSKTPEINAHSCNTASLTRDKIRVRRLHRESEIRKIKSAEVDFSGDDCVSFLPQSANTFGNVGRPSGVASRPLLVRSGGFVQLQKLVIKYH